MQWKLITARRGMAAALAVLSFTLSGCGHFDAEAYWFPESFRAKKYVPAAPDPKPDVEAFVRDHWRDIFASEVSDVKIGRPRPDGQYWNFCTLSFAKNITGSWNEAMILVKIEGGKVGERRRATPTDGCSAHDLENGSVAIE